MPNVGKIKRAARYLAAYFNKNCRLPSGFRYGGVTVRGDVVRVNGRIAAFLHGTAVTMVELRHLRKSALYWFTEQFLAVRRYYGTTVTRESMAVAVRAWRLTPKDNRKYGTMVVVPSEEKTLRKSHWLPQDMVLHSARSLHSHAGWDIRKLRRKLVALSDKYGGSYT